jgi:alanyl-tRNA synthetase
VTSDEIRAAFLSFFEEKGHKIISSSSLIPHGDPTLLLTSAGMVQFKPYFLGEAIPPGPRLASCQKCFRTTDIESVGDTTHLTFFEMLGNFSVGDYFKPEAISWAWEFVTQRLGLPPERLWVTIFTDDDESFHIWREIGIPEPRILRLGEKDNFWGPAGSSGPCGPCSEIHYDFGEEIGCGKESCAPGCDCGRFSEIWNLVFNQYNQDEAGHRTLLPKPNIDTGMGLERTAAAIQGKTSVYETDLFTPVIERISKLAGKKYGSDNSADNAMRIIAEHSRGIAFLIADGVMPSNEGRGYVLRRLLRRAALFGRRLGLDEPFLVKTAKITIEQMGHIYPEIVQRQDFINKVVELEEARFSETLSTGLELLDEIMEGATVKKTGKILGEQAFKLYDTYGFPVELTKEIAAEHGFSIDREGFEKEMEKQRERAKAAHKFEVTARGTAGTYEQFNSEATPFVGYQNLKHKSAIISLLVDNKPTDTIQVGQEASLVLKDTPFYGEMGGQVGDTGEINSPSGRFAVSNTIRTPPDIIVHQGHVTEGSLSIGDDVEAVVDVERRLDIARNHTATHLLQFALRQVFGEHVQQRGSLVAPDRFRFDFSHLTAMTPEEIREVQRIVNEKIRQNLKVYDEEIPYKQAIGEGAIALFDEKYGDTVRVLKIGEPFISAELCGGTHVTATGEIGFFQIIGESSIGTGLRRIEAVTGRGAEAIIHQRFSDLQSLAEYLDTELDSVPDKAYSLATELDKERKRALALERELSKKTAESLLNQAEVVNGVKVLTARVPTSRPQVLREMSDLLRERLGSGVVVLGTVYESKPAFIAAVTPDLVAKGYNASEIVKQVAKITGGGGGGKATLAQAGGKDKNKLDEALRLVRSLI